MTPLSPHFTLEELTFSQKALRLGIDNTPPVGAEANLTALANNLLEPARAILAAHFGHEVLFRIDSGYRCPELNEDVGGATHSAHMDGRASDTIPMGVPLKEAFDVLRASADLPYDQIIFECAAWIHIASAPAGAEPRREALVATGGPGHWTYVPA